MDEKKFFYIALNLPDPLWHVVSIDFDQGKGRIDIHIAFHSGSIFLCPKCSSWCLVHDTIQKGVAASQFLPVQDIHPCQGAND